MNRLSLALLTLVLMAGILFAISQQSARLVLALGWGHEIPVTVNNCQGLGWSFSATVTVLPWEKADGAITIECGLAATSSEVGIYVSQGNSTVWQEGTRKSATIGLDITTTLVQAGANQAAFMQTIAQKTDPQQTTTVPSSFGWQEQLVGGIGERVSYGLVSEAFGRSRHEPQVTRAVINSPRVT